MEHLQEKMKFNWRKKGLVYTPNLPGFTHGSHPTIIHVREDIFVIAFTCRDTKQRSHVFLSYAQVSNGNVVLKSEPKLALAPGEFGYFDCDGVISVCLIKNNGEYYLYYVGWQNLPDGLWLCDTGRAILDIERLTAQKEFPGPVLGRDKSNPLFTAATAFYITNNGIWHTLYNSGLRWERTSNGLKPYYGIHHAKSTNGIDWICDPGLCIPFADEYEYAFGRPCIVFWDNLFYLWFAHRATKNISTYRIGFASSKDGLKWDRNDAAAGIDVSAEGWDSEMICYPFVFEHKGKRYMLYNGNSYGKTGFGLAIMEDD